MRRLVQLVVSLLVLLSGTHAARALTVVARDFAQLVARADTIFKGVVTAKTSLWVGEGEDRHIATRVTFAVAETYKGEATAAQTLEFVGGTVDGQTLRIDGVPTFEVGQNAVLFVVGNGRQFCPLVGIQQGRFHVVRDADSGTERILTDELLPVADTADLGQFDEGGTSRVQRSAATHTRGIDAADFKAQILHKVAALPR